MATRVTIGDDLVSYITYLDEDQNPVEGATLSVELALDPNGLSFDVVIDDLGGGSYVATRTTGDGDPIGVWYLLLRDHVTGATFDQEWVLSAREADDVQDVNPLITYFTYLRPDLSPVLGATFTVLQTVSPDGTTFPVTVTEVGFGAYRITGNVLSTDYSGEWYVSVRGSVDNSVFHHTWDIEDIPPVIISLLDIDGTALRTIRAMVARQIRDYRRVVAKGGSTSTIVDPIDLRENVDFFRGADILVISGHVDNVGRVVRAVSSSYDAATVTFDPPLPRPVKYGDVFEFFNFARTRFRITEYDHAINDAIWNGFPQNRELVAVDLVSPVVYGAPWLAVPDEFTHVSGVVWLGTDNVWRTVPPSRFPYHDGWYVVKEDRRVVFSANYAAAMVGKAVRLFGARRPPRLTQDTDTTKVDVEWIIDMAVGNLLASEMDQATFAIAQSRLNRADQLRAKMAVNAPPNIVAL